ncbi:hypothetical protein B0T17DRAFT_531609 [Bombardia bombarda]|uniref:Uncharacterized protein n=1 Tax=Bombardia bombarda TaxID=252184 RepID=A0AA39X0E5_9PEZI|nr:hypothetical protein B0T17DRAFT_531609 [Bombardia bombarda]
MATTDRESNAATGDSGPGTEFRDLLPIPAVNSDDITVPGQNGGVASGPTFSHQLATDDHEQKGMAQLDHEKEVLNLGWNEKKEMIPAPLVGGMGNEELWMLQIYQLKATPYPVPGGLDLNIADEEEFSPDKLRTGVERLYMTVGVGLLAAVKHVARLRSWRESRRTACFAGAYFVAWLFDFLVPLTSVVIIALITYPPSRHFLFPPAPVALVDSSTGGLQKPGAGVLGSHDSAMGAPENHKGEAVEKEASNFVNTISSVVLSSATGKPPQGPESDGQQSAITAEATDPTSSAPMEQALWKKMRPIMHMIGDVTDTWERFANALSPTPPFPRETSRLRIATLVIPVFGLSLFVTSYMFMKGVTFGIGFGFFGDPVISRGLDWLNRTIPDWKKLFEMRNTILKGVPTNAQLTITLLRPPPAKPAALTDDHLRATGGDDAPMDASPAEIAAAIRHDPLADRERQDGSDIDHSTNAHHGKLGHRIVGFVRNATKGLVKTAVGADTVRAKAGISHHAKERLGVIPKPDAVPVSGPVEFKARYNGKKGHVYLSTTATIPMLAFSAKETMEEVGGQKREDLHPAWSVAVADIAELKKIGGYGWKAKLVVGWSMERELADGLEIRTVERQVYKITAVPLRDELFNRVVAMGAQKWEAW